MRLLWRSVVGKLWATILLFFAVVLTVLAILLMQFFRSYIVETVTEDLINTGKKIAVVLESYDDFSYGLETAFQILDDVTNAIIITDENHIYYSKTEDQQFFNLAFFQEHKGFSKVFTEDKIVEQEITIPVSEENRSGIHNRMIIIGIPLHLFSDQQGAVFIYQSLHVMQEAFDETTKIIWLAAFISFCLTTFFALFLSRQISKPLLKMREAAVNVTKGRFDARVPIYTNDEIGELAKVINKMTEQLKVNMTQLQQEKEQLSSVLSSMADGVIMFNRQGQIMLTNPPAETFLRLMEYEGNGAKGCSVPEEIMELFQQVLDTEKEKVGDLSVQGRFWTIIVSPLYDVNQIRGAVAVIRDMTEQKQLDKIRTDFIANVSHELRTPVAMLQGYSEALLDDVVGTEEDRREIAMIIYEESKRMGRLVNELLDLAKMESGTFSLDRQKVAIEPYLNKIVKKFAGLAKDNKVILEKDLSGNDRIYYFDPDRIEQVLTNLIDNAIRHSHAGGRIIVKEYPGKDGFYLEVIDEGSGIPKEDLPFVFERFYKADKARTRGSSGTGLGLAIAKNIVVAHGGTIDVKSKIGEGTTFTIFLPDENHSE